MAIDLAIGALATSLVLASVPDGAPLEAAPVPPRKPEAVFGLFDLAEEDVFCLAQAIYFEARGEPIDGRRAVAAVVLNRVEDPFFPDTICEVVYQGKEEGPCQFSWWCDGLSDVPKDAVAWADARSLAREMLTKDIDPTEGALYFHAQTVRPYWADHFERVAQLGSHIYYR